MKNKMRAAKRNQSPGNVNYLVAPEMRRHIRELKRGLVQCGYPLLDHLGYLDTVVAALGIAERSAECLLADYPFKAWDKVLEKDEWDELCDTREKQEAKTTAWPAPGSADTELGVLMEPEVCHGETEVYTGVQA
jgi:hypothetical protein